ncbi:MAG: TonB-dependent receptor plug domain-containing protein [Steroidobacteraceae bacterium]
MANRNIAHAVRTALYSAAAIGAAFQAAPAVAQDQQEQLGEVIVTGSRIPRANLTAPTAVTTIDAEVINQSGLINVADILRAVPSFGVSALTSANSNFLTTSSGINTLQLRNLEEDRTLVLVNGRRYVSGLAGSAAVDFNTIPTELIERVEIITGGASAIYGSDALAGVINVILRDDFEGVRFGYQYGEADAGGEIENRINFTAGGDFADGRGNAVITAAYTEQKGTLARQRANTRVDDIAECLFTGDPADCKTPVEGFFSSFSEHGRFFVPSTGESFTVSQGSGPTGTVVPWDLAEFGFNRQQFRRYTVPTERYLVASTFDYEMGDKVNAFVETTFAQTRTDSELEPFPHSNDDLNIGGIPVDNPFVPQAIRDAVLAAGDTEIQYFRRTTEIGNRGASAKRNTYRFLVGLEGDVAEKYNWQSYYAFGRMDDSQQGGGQINVLSMREALDVIDGDGNPATLDPICASEAARAEGCVPINLFGLGSISPEAADYVRAPTSRQQFTEQQVAGVEIGGPMFELPAGPVSFALGAEYRQERAEDVPDVLTQAGLNAGNAEAPTFGDYHVKEAFAEIEVPLLSGVTGVDELSLGGAYRFSDYSTVDTTNAYAGRLSWAPVESLRFRLQFAHAVRAPNIGELFAPGGENFAPVADPCNGVTAATTGNIAENCRAIPAIAARIADQGVFALTQPEIQGTGGFTGQGNEALDVEESDSWSFGTVFNRNVGEAGDLTVSIDYFAIEIDELIDTLDRQITINNCFNVAPASFPNEFCGFLTRDADGAAFQQGELTEVNTIFFNEGKLETEGVDLSVLWNWEMSDWFAGIPGQAGLRLNYTYLLDFTETKFGAENEQVGDTGFARNKGQTALLYSVGPWDFTWEWNYIGDSKPLSSDPLFSFDVGAYNVHDLQLAFDFGNGGQQESMLGGTRLYIGANNVFDEDAPVILSGVPGNVTGTDTDASVYNPIGRTWYVGLNFSF